MTITHNDNTITISQGFEPAVLSGPNRFDGKLVKAQEHATILKVAQPFSDNYRAVFFRRGRRVIEVQNLKGGAGKAFYIQNGSSTLTAAVFEFSHIEQSRTPSYEKRRKS